jgi:hypothetical protein
MSDDAITMRRPICAEDPPEVWAIFAELLADYAVAIERDVADILSKFPFEDPEGWTIYVNAIGENIPDPVIKTAVKRLAISKIRQAGATI